MKNKKSFHYCFAASGIFVICGCIHLLCDWLRYSNTLNSAPFSLWILMNLLGFGGAAAVCAVIGLILWKRDKRRKDDIR